MNKFCNPINEDIDFLIKINDDGHMSI